MEGSCSSGLRASLRLLDLTFILLKEVKGDGSRTLIAPIWGGIIGRGSNLLMTQIKTPFDLKSVAAQLNDARFIASEIHYEKHEQLFHLKCWQREREQRSKPHPWKAWSLCFHQVLASTIIIHEEVKFYELSTIRFLAAEQRVDLITHYGAELTLVVEE